MHVMSIYKRFGQITAHAQKLEASSQYYAWRKMRHRQSRGKTKSQRGRILMQAIMINSRWSI